MSRFSASIATTGFAFLLLAAAIPAQTQAQTQTPDSMSRVRIVRLSEVRGAVQLDRGIGDGYESAIMNMPVVEHNRLKTAMGLVEVEFENSSTLRLGPYSEVEFSTLARTGQGATVSTVRLIKGIAYVSLVKNSGKLPRVFDLAFGDRNLRLQPGTHVRLEISGQQAKLAVFKGNVQAHGPNQLIDVSRKHTATFALANDTQPVVAKGLKSEPLTDAESQSLLDSWDKRSAQYHARVASLTDFGGVPYSYGASDMLYYGSFQDIGDCGMMWRPYFASAAWDPYANGTWAYYSGAGYSWVSPYPWGWTPYHYGSWSFCPGAGWGWMPGGSWMGLNNIAFAGSAAPAAPGRGIKIAGLGPIAPRRPRIGQPSLVVVNRAALVHSGFNSRGSFVFRRDSAGLGIPRQELGNLRGFSRHAIQRGVATTPVYMTMAPRPTNGMRGAGNTPGMHRGYAPTRGGLSNARPSGNLGNPPAAAGGNSVPMQSAPPMSPAPVMRSAPAMGSPAPSGGRGPR